MRMRLILASAAVMLTPLACAAQTLPGVTPMALSGSDATPAPPGPGSWITDADYPETAVQADAEGTVRFKVAVSAAGAVTQCTIVSSSGSPALDAKTCELVSARARFDPARDTAGKPVAGSYSASIRWKLPTSAQAAARNVLRFRLTADRRVADCTASTETPTGATPSPTLCDDLQYDDFATLAADGPVRVLVQIVSAPETMPDFAFAPVPPGYVMRSGNHTRRTVDARGQTFRCEVIETVPAGGTPCPATGPMAAAPAQPLSRVQMRVGIWVAPSP